MKSKKLCKINVPPGTIVPIGKDTFKMKTPKRGWASLDRLGTFEEEFLDTGDVDNDQDTLINEFDTQKK